jgi:hypothetical protein
MRCKATGMPIRSLFLEDPKVYVQGNKSDFSRYKNGLDDICWLFLFLSNALIDESLSAMGKQCRTTGA